MSLKWPRMWMLLYRTTTVVHLAEFCALSAHRVTVDQGCVTCQMTDQSNIRRLYDPVEQNGSDTLRI